VQKALPLFKDGGSIILNSSVSNVLGLPGFTAYAASKAAVRNFARGWTMELKDRKIRVNSMSPGAIDTPALATTTGLTAEQAEQAVAQFTSQIPMGRRGKPEEIAAAVTFLASDESSYITGVDLAVDGGMAQVWLTGRCKGNGEISMSIKENVQIVKDFFAAMGRGDKQGLLALSAEDIEWIIPGEDWPLAGTHRGHAGLEICFRRLPKRWKLRTQSPPNS
jgi:hypothetical protein